MKRYITIVTATTVFLLAASSFNSMAAFAQGGANIIGMPTQKTAIIHLVQERKSAQQIRDEIKSNHPLLVAIADEIQTMDERESVKNTLCVEIASDLLKMHAEDQRVFISSF